MTGFFAPGDTVRYRSYFGGTLMSVTPVRVVRHDDGGLLTWTAGDTPLWRRRDAAGRALRDVPRGEWPAALSEDVWFGHGVLVLMGAAGLAAGRLGAR
ncbi:hypothetical protein GCM10022220_69120 [Actinocatenispora rupis]|uniref:hypothetical protein n=1 Tax=Actinocatenispora rupis TaxID=519421 RepID=UPI0031EAADDC